MFLLWADPFQGSLRNRPRFERVTANNDKLLHPSGVFETSVLQVLNGRLNDWDSWSGRPPDTNNVFCTGSGNNNSNDNNKNKKKHPTRKKKNRKKKKKKEEEEDKEKEKEKEKKKEKEKEKGKKKKKKKKKKNRKRL